MAAMPSEGKDLLGRLPALSAQSETAWRQAGDLRRPRTRPTTESWKFSVLATRDCVEARQLGMIAPAN